LFQSVNGTSKGSCTSVSVCENQCNYFLLVEEAWILYGRDWQFVTGNNTGDLWREVDLINMAALSQLT
jgi:hypothetical protein